MRLKQLLRILPPKQRIRILEPNGNFDTGTKMVDDKLINEIFNYKILKIYSTDDVLKIEIKNEQFLSKI